MLIYLADLYHDYLPTRQHVPLGISYLATYAKSVFGSKVDFKLFKSVDKLLDSIEQNKPDLIGFSNYTWNVNLNKFAIDAIKGIDANIPLIMGGPNIRTDEDGILQFLKENPEIDKYVMYAGEKPTVDIINTLLALPINERTGSKLRSIRLESSYSYVDDALIGAAFIDPEKVLNYIPSPYTSGLLDEFLDNGFLPIIETNRGCPFSCTFCVWGISALSKIKQFSLDRVKEELNYISYYGKEYSEIVFADANFGILEKDVEIAQHIRNLYDETASFQFVLIFWSKSAKDFMIDIGRILGHLTDTYIAFQSLDPVVLQAIKRKNISTDKLLTLINKLSSYTHSTQTDILVGLPEETYASHLQSLETALSYGINRILGGEIRMLPGSEMDSKESREKFKIKSKFRLCEGQYGYYRNKLVYELDESIRETSAMSEQEMIQLRVFRTIFFAAITLGELRPLISFLVKNNYSVVQFIQKIVERDDNFPHFNQALDWCNEKANEEWFENHNAIKEHLSHEENAAELFGDNPFMKLNYGMFSHILAHQDQYDDFYKKMEMILNDSIYNTHKDVAIETLHFCRSRNLIVSILNDNIAKQKNIKLSPECQIALSETDYLPTQPILDENGAWNMQINSVTEKQIIEVVNEFKKVKTTIRMSQILERYRGRSYLEPEMQSVS